jgi:hypothetical protein
MLNRLDRLERRWGWIIVGIAILMIVAFVTLTLLFEPTLASTGGLLVIVGAVIAAVAPLRILTSRDLVTLLRTSASSKWFAVRLFGFVVLLIGLSLLVRDRATTSLEFFLSALVLGLVFINYIMYVPHTIRKK